MADEFRTEVKVRLFCSIHPETELHLSTKSKTEGESAFDLTIRLVVYPCAKCQGEANRIKEAVKILRES